MINNRLLKKLDTQKAKLDSVLGEVELALKDYVAFDFSVFYQPSDGFVILNYDAASNAPLISCVQWIKEHGTLSGDDHEGLSL